LFNFGEWTKDISLELQPGFTSQSYSSEDGLFSVYFSMSVDEPGVFYQWFTGGKTGICIEQRVDQYS